MFAPTSAAGQYRSSEFRSTTSSNISHMPRDRSLPPAGELIILPAMHGHAIAWRVEKGKQ